MINPSCPIPYSILAPESEGGGLLYIFLWIFSIALSRIIMYCTGKFHEIYMVRQNANGLIMSSFEIFL